MRPLKEMEIGLVFRAGSNPAETLKPITALGLRCGQLGVAGDATPDARAWRAALDARQFSLVTIFAAYSGESYADIPTIQRTVGFIPRATRSEREARTCALSDFAAALGVGSIACHAGFLPEDTAHPDYVAVRDVVRRVADHAAGHRQTFALETGQEPAHALLDFLRAVDRPNLRINFDPANMILYGTGDPIDALSLLGEHVVTVHCKDGNWPRQDVPGALGVEAPLGEGAVGIARFIARLQEIGYKGPLIIEREIKDQEQKLHDVRTAIRLLRGYGGQLHGLATERIEN